MVRCRNAKVETAVLAGIRGGDYAVLTAGKSYSLTVYTVYRREYFGTIGDFYVYVADFR